MRPRTQEGPAKIEAWAGPESNPSEKLQAHFNPDSGFSADEAIAILRQAQAVVACMLPVIDRMAAEIARAVSR